LTSLSLWGPPSTSASPTPANKPTPTATTSHSRYE
jgi:hypothetical protein